VSPTAIIPPRKPRSWGEKRDVSNLQAAPHFDDPFDDHLVIASGTGPCQPRDVESTRFSIKHPPINQPPPIPAEPNFPIWPGLPEITCRRTPILNAPDADNRNRLYQGFWKVPGVSLIHLFPRVHLAWPSVHEYTNNLARSST
jgi:hypothetical protein